MTEGLSPEAENDRISELVSLVAIKAERDAYRNTLLDIAHLEDSPAAGANIAARTLNEWRGDRDPVVAGPWPTVFGDEAVTNSVQAMRGTRLAADEWGEIDR